jgi:hypothetical protein
MKVICINDKNRPSDIPISKWIVEGEMYTVVKVMKCNAQGGIYGFQLEEVDLNGCEPYLYFVSDRFSPIVTLPMRTEEVELEMEILQ